MCVCALFFCGSLHRILSMVARSFYLGEPQSKRLQPGERTSRVRVTLSKEARALLYRERTDKRRSFKRDIDETLDMIETAARTIATKHRKSLQSVRQGLHLARGSTRIRRTKANPWNAFCWKKGCTKKKENGRPSQNDNLLLLTT